MVGMEHDAVKALISEAIAPLEQQIKELRSELEAIRATLGGSATDSSPADVISSSGAEPSVSSSAESASSSNAESSPSSAEPLSEIPAERTDFMRFIQRGLEQEEKEYKDEPAAKAEKKIGWNPFKR